MTRRESSDASEPAVAGRVAADGEADADRLLAELKAAVDRAPVRPQRIEVGIPLSIALGRRRGSVSCGGCSVPLEFEGIPAETNARLTVPFRFVTGPGAAA